MQNTIDEKFQIFVRLIWHLHLGQEWVRQVCGVIWPKKNAILNTQEFYDIFGIDSAEVARDRQVLSNRLPTRPKHLDVPHDHTVIITAIIFPSTGGMQTN